MAAGRLIPEAVRVKLWLNLKIIIGRPRQKPAESRSKVVQLRIGPIRAAAGEGVAIGAIGGNGCCPKVAKRELFRPENGIARAIGERGRNLSVIVEETARRPLCIRGLGQARIGWIRVWRREILGGSEGEGVSGIGASGSKRRAAGILWAQ